MPADEAGKINMIYDLLAEYREIFKYILKGKYIQEEQVILEMVLY